MATLAAATTVGVAWWLGTQGTQSSAAPTRERTATVQVTRQTLVATETFEGTLGYASTRGLLAGRDGTVTALPAQGTVVDRGEALYAIEGRKTTLLYGETPAYREMSVGTEGRDVRQLERNLRALGFGDDLEVDGYYSWYTAEAVEEWQESLSLEETGIVAEGDVVFSAGEVRVVEQKLSVGDVVTVGQELLSISGTDRIVTVEMDVDDRPLAEVGRRVSVTLPDGRSAEGRIVEVGAVLESDEESAADDEAADESATFEVEVQLSNDRRVRDLDAAPVQVMVVSQRQRNALVVPVNALVATTAGGYGVRVVDNDGRRLVEVTLGMFADGLVEVTGGDLEAGQEVEVPRS